MRGRRGRKRRVDLVRREARLGRLDILADGLNGPMFRLFPGADEPGWPRHLRKWLRRRLAASERIRREEDAAWALAEELVMECLARPATESVPASVKERFNRLALGVPFVLLLGGAEVNPRPVGPFPWPKAEPHETIIPDRVLFLGTETRGDGAKLMRMTQTWFVAANSRGHVVALLRDFFTSPARDRLRKCPVCGRWFVDHTKNKARVRCSAGCTAKWWNRARRRAARHSQYARRGARVGGARTLRAPAAATSRPFDDARIPAFTRRRGGRLIQRRSPDEPEG